MARYGQYCPIAKALELLGERWTLLIVRELLMGSRRFNELRRGVPLMSPSMLSQRLRTLTEAGVVVREAGSSTVTPEYHLTPAGEELRPLILQLGTWGQRWSRSTMAANDLDASFLMWDIRRNVRADKLPERRTVIYFEYPDAKKTMRRWWLVVDRGEVDLCLEDPGFEVDVMIGASLATMTRVWMGDLPLGEARAAGLVKILGARHLARSVGDWLGLSPFASVAPARQAGSATSPPDRLA
ncbi:MAG TPA: helix-turn-helix domain-containing protein [Burkholderiales bacterium]|jgi:DNA-binding HxlR family transcriptional regulator|nr:helix-turn-helix domain-containing protein [Burkholderiales bacterium]